MRDSLRLAAEAAAGQAPSNPPADSEAPETASARPADPAAAALDRESEPAPSPSYRWLALAASVLLFAAALSLAVDRRLESRLAAQRALAGELHLLAQRLQLDAHQAFAPDGQGFERLRAASERFSAALATFERARAEAGALPAPAPQRPGDALAALQLRWNALEPALRAVVAQAEAVREAGVRRQALAVHTQALPALLQRLAAAGTEARLQPDATEALRQVETDLDAARLAYLPLALSSPSADPALPTRLEEAMVRAAATLARMVREPSPVQDAARALHDALKPALNDVERLRELTPLFVRAYAASGAVVGASDALLNDAASLVRSYPPYSFAASRWMWFGLAAGVAAFGCLLWILKAMLANAERRAAVSLQSAARDRRAHERTQEAILRLLDEMSRLAQGDLTVRANVADEVTGAVADAINYAVGELRRLVLGIHSAANRLAQACVDAQELSGELLNASQRQTQEIVDTAASVAAVTRSATEISERAAASAKAAETSLQAAQQGSLSVRRSVAGIEVIRQQVQETAKRIKRLGESSQEIGESVELIGEISERTHVLALNAAIQAGAASVGRGFGLIADEVRGLAERSASAARQIDSLVKAIQVETQDATSAMERSTARVVEQTQLAQSAGQALKRIDEHARRLALLTEAISTATRAQSEAAQRIDAAMAEIARVTELAAEATRRSADSSAALAALAAELKALVTGFKVS